MDQLETSSYHDRTGQVQAGIVPEMSGSAES